MGKSTTLKDIAEKLQVSISTVSRVLNGNHVKAANPKLQDAIWKAAKEMNYVPNTAAQLLKGKKKEREELRTIACVFARTQETQNDPFFLEISRALENELLKHRYIMKFSIYGKDLPANMLESFLKSEKVDGVIILGRPNKQMMKLIRKHHRYVVYVGLNKIEEDIDQVICDGYEAGMEAMRYLGQIGLQDIFYLGETQQEIRYRAYKDYMQQNGRGKMLGITTIESPFHLQGAYEKMKRFLKKGRVPEGLFCGNDLTALGALKALKEEGIRVPEDISIIGIDDISMSGFSSPSLTTVGIPKEQLGKKAARLLVDRIRHGNDLPISMLVPFKMVKRDSTKNI